MILCTIFKNSSNFITQIKYKLFKNKYNVLNFCKHLQNNNIVISKLINKKCIIFGEIYSNLKINYESFTLGHLL